MFERYKRSFTAKLSLSVILVVTAISAVLFVFFYNYSQKALMQEAEDQIKHMAAIANLKVSALLSEVEKIPDNLSGMISKYVKEPDSLFSITRQVVKNNDEIFGCAIAFEPYYYPRKGQYFAPYSYMNGDSIVTMQVGGENYNYFEKGWYKGGREGRYWSKPYRDVGNPDVITTSYAVPLYGKKGELIGVISVDLTNKWLRELANSIKPYEGSYTVIIDRAGRYIMRKEGEATIGKNMFEFAEKSDDPNMNVLVKEMAAGKSGSIVVRDGNVKSYVFYTSVFATDWYLAVVCPYDEVFGRLSRFNLLILPVFVFIMVIIYMVCFLTVKQITRPLTLFSNSAKTIAHGDFNTSLADIRSKDELGELYDSFMFMQEQLASYVKQLQATTSENEKIESELRIAHNIQLKMVPEEIIAVPCIRTVDIQGILCPARQVGGDLYDYLMLNDDEFGFAIGDVSGKGIPASLFMAITISQIRTVAIKDSSLNYIVNWMNQSLFRSGISNMFVTFFAGVLNLNTGTLKYCNCGHPYPIIIRPDGTVEEFCTMNNLPLGMSETYVYKEQQCTIYPGTQFVLYSDGITDAQNEKGESYSLRRLINLVEKNKEASVRQMINIIAAEVNEHSGKAKQTDDMTLLCFRYIENERRSVNFTEEEMENIMS